MQHSLSLSFSLSPAGSQEHGPVIRSPSPVMGHQPSPSPAAARASSVSHVSPSLDPMDLLHLPESTMMWLRSVVDEQEWKIWVETRNPRPFKIQTIGGLSTLENLKQLRLSPNFHHDPYNFGFFAVQTQKAAANAPRKYAQISLAMIQREIIEGSKQYVNELFFPDIPTKPMFDIDWPTGELGVDDNAKARFLLGFIGHISRLCGYSSDPADYSIMECFHDSKVSFHIIGNFAQHYASNRHQNIHMLACGVDFRKYHVDSHLYNTNAQLRVAGSGKWDDKPYSPFILMGTRHTQLWMDKFRDCLAQVVPANSKLIEVELQENRLFANADRDIEAILGYLRANFDQEDLTASAKNNDGKTLKFEVDELICCGHEHRGAVIFADIREGRKTMRIQCKEFCPEIQMGYTVKSDKFLRQLYMIDFFRENGLARISMPIYDSSNPDYRSFGFFETSPAELCEKLAVPMPDPWEFFTVDRRRGGLIDPEFFAFIRSSQPGHFNPDDKYYEPTRDRLCAYMALFAIHIQATDNWYCRTKTGIVRQKKATVVNEFFGSCCYEIIKTVGRGEDKEEKIIEKPFFPYFEKKGNPSMAGLTMGPLNLTSETRVALTPAKRVDVRKAFMKFVQAPKGHRDCLRAIWKSLITMCVAYEEEDVQVRLKDFVEDWVMSIMFDSFHATQICLVLMSAGGGQGKSSLGNFICSFLGNQLSTSGQSANAFFQSTANSWNNFIWLDELKANHDTADRLKEAITAKTVLMRNLYEMPVQEPNYRNFLCATNKELVMGVNARGTERRFCVCKFLDVAQLAPEMFVYECTDPLCERPIDQFGDVLPCRMHSYDGHSAFVGRFHSLITNKEDPKKDELVNGPLFEEFVGMFYSMWLEKKGTRVGSIQSRLVHTKATEECQIKVETQTGKFIEACNTNGYHISPSITPKEKTCWIIPTKMEKPAGYEGPPIMDLTTFEAKRSKTPVWERFVAKDTLYTFYCEWAHSSGFSKVPSTIFFEQLEEICRSRLGYSVIETAKRVKCEKLIYSREGGEMRPSFKNSDDVAHDAVILDMSSGPWLKPVRPQLVRSASAVAIDQPTPPMNMADVVERRPLQQSNTRFLVADEEERMERQEYLEQERARKNLTRVLEREDANDGYFEEQAAENTHKRIQDEEVEDSGERDEAFARFDARAEKRLKTMSRAGLDLDVIEDNNYQSSGESWEQVENSN